MAEFSMENPEPTVRLSALGDTPPPYVHGGSHYHNTSIPQAGYLVGSKTMGTTTCTTNSGGECGVTATHSRSLA